MKFIKKPIVILALVVTLVPLAFMACSKSFLYQNNTQQTTASASFNTSSDVIELVNSIYDTYQNSDFLKKTIWYWANFETHDFFNWGGDVVWNNYQIPSTFGAIETMWDQSYLGIARANYTLEEMPDALNRHILDQGLANRLSGEAYFLRGTFYYYLASSFGGVPLELKTGSNGLTSRSSRDSVFMQVVSDMQQAEKLLLSKKDLAAADLGRATKGAAYGYEGAAQMWLKNYKAALDAFNNPELTNNYHLLPNYINVGEYNNQNNDESLFEIQFETPPGASQSWDGSWQTPGGEIAWIDSFDWPEEITQQGYTYGNPALWSSFQQGDLRKYATIVGPGDTLVSPGIIAAWGGIKGYPPVQSGFAGSDSEYIGDDGKIINTPGTKTRPWYGPSSDHTGYFCSKKWRDPNLTGNYGNPHDPTGQSRSYLFGDQNQVFLRYAEIILDRAECKVRTGDNAGAIGDITLVRNRAFGGAAPAVMKDSANFDGTPGQPITDPLQMVLSEYRHELGGEYSVFYDLCRAGSDEAIAFIKKENGTVDGSLNPIVNPAPGPTHDGKQHGLYNTTPGVNDLLMPIPQHAKSLNPNLVQNPGY